MFINTNFLPTKKISDSETNTENEKKSSRGCLLRNRDVRRSRLTLQGKRKFGMGDEEEEPRQAAIIRRNWHWCSRWDADLIYLSRLSGILILVRGRAFSNSGSLCFLRASPVWTPSISFYFALWSFLFLCHPCASSSSWTARGATRIACELVVSQGFELLQPFRSLLSSLLSHPLKEGSQRGRHKSDTL